MMTKMKKCKEPIGGYKCDKPFLTLKKACNTRPCKKGEKSENPKAKEEAWKFKQPSLVLPIQLESRYVSHRFQQYEECRIKDEDLCIRRQDLVKKLNIQVAPILPGRGVLNKNTFSF